MKLHERSHPKEMNAVGEIVVSPSLPCPLAGSQRSLYPPRADEAAASRDTDEVTASRAAAVPDRRHHRTMRASSSHCRGSRSCSSLAGGRRLRSATSIEPRGAAGEPSARSTARNAMGCEYGGSVRSALAHPASRGRGSSGSRRRDRRCARGTC